MSVHSRLAFLPHHFSLDPCHPCHPWSTRSRFGSFALGSSVSSNQLLIELNLLFCLIELIRLTELRLLPSLAL